MRKLVTIGIVILTLLMALTVPIYATEPTEPHNANNMWIEPSESNIPPTLGHKFNVTVWINLTVTCGSWEFELVYNNTYVNATRAGYTNGTASEFFRGLSAFPVSPIFDAVNSTFKYVLHAETILVAPYREPGYGSLAWVEFNVTATPPEGETPTFSLDISEFYPAVTFAQDEEGTKIDMDVNNALVVIPEFSTLAMILLLLAAASMLIYLRKSRKY